MGKWQRVLCLSNANGYLLRGAPDDNNVIYVADDGGTTIYYSSEGGDNRWYLRSAPANLADLAVESADVCYIGTGGQIRKSVNSGFTWDLPVTPELEGENVATLNSIAEDQLIVGGYGVAYSYTTDGGTTWMKDVPFTAPPTVGGAPVHIAATGLDKGDYIYLVAEKAGQQVYRRTVGDPPFIDYKALTTAAGVIGSSEIPTDIVL
jgi:photosystem II stability/assembly factor-like uncharacterized protein